MKVILTEYQLSDLEMETSKLNIGSSRKETFCVRIGKKLPTSDRNIFLQFGNNVKAPQVRTFEYTRILLKSISNDISDSINRKDKYTFLSKEEFSLDISVKLTSDGCSLNNSTIIISYKSISVNSNVAEASNYQSQYTIIDKLGIETSTL